VQSRDQKATARIEEIAGQHAAMSNGWGGGAMQQAQETVYGQVLAEWYERTRGWRHDRTALLENEGWVDGGVRRLRRNRRPPTVPAECDALLASWRSRAKTTPTPRARGSRRSPNGARPERHRGLNV
jgi:hypothetical protein